MRNPDCVQPLVSVLHGGQGPSRRSLLGGAAALAASAALAPAALAQAPPPAGPKKRLAVARFDAVSSFVAAYGSTDIGGGLAAQLATLLIESGQFLVVERHEMSQILGEQELGARGAVTAETASKVGNLLGAQILVVAAVTAYEVQAKGGGMTLGLGGMNLGGGIGRKTTRGKLGMDFRLVDTTTGRVLGATRTEAELKQTANSLDIVKSGVNMSQEQFSNTVLGEAAREAIQKALPYIERTLSNVAWVGHVADVTGDQVFLSAGAQAGVREGDRFSISRVARQVTDPVSGELLGVVEERLGQVQVAVVQDRFCIAAKLTDFTPNRGDIARYATA